MSDNKSRKRSATPHQSQDELISDLRNELSKIKALHKKEKELIAVKEEDYNIRYNK